MAFADTTLKTYAETSKAMFDYWISFHPAAPIFGVEWRFGDAFMPGMTVPAPESASDTPIQTDTIAETATETDECNSQAVAAVEANAVVLAAEIVEPSVDDEFEDAETKVDVPALLYAEPPAKIDDLKVLKGVGPSLETQLHDLGIYTFEQLAGFDDAQLEWLDENLRTVKGRCIRDDWAGQAKSFLA